MDKVNIYPNAADDFVVIDAAEIRINATLLDLVGQTVIAPISVNGKRQILLSGLGPGIYLLILTDSIGVRQTERIVKQ